MPYKRKASRKTASKPVPKAIYSKLPLSAKKAIKKAISSTRKKRY